MLLPGILFCISDSMPNCGYLTSKITITNKHTKKATLENVSMTINWDAYTTDHGCTAGAETLDFGIIGYGSSVTKTYTWT